MSKLFISRLLLVNYKRMSLAGFTRFEFTPDETYVLQQVLGTNGSGKSSLMHQLWFLPSNENDFGVNGRCEIEGYYEGRFYQLVSTFEGKPHYSFKVDGVEKNEGGKIGMCLSLCEEHLKVTPEIRALALGKERLTNMGPARRRYWLVKLADTDFTYALGVYNKLKEAHRDAQGSIKRLNQRLITEKAKLADPSVIDQLNTEVRDIKELINEIYGLRNAEAKKGSEVLEVLESNYHDLDRYGNEIDRLDTEVISTSGFDSESDMADRRDAVKMEIHVAQQLQQHLFTDHNRIKKKYDVLIKAGTESLVELQDRLERAQVAITYEESFIAMKNVAIDTDPAQMASTLKDIYNELYDRISSLPSNKDLFTREKQAISEKRHYELHVEAEKLRHRIAKLSVDLEHARDHIQKDSITCPKCEHSWTTRASEEDIRKAEGALIKLKDDFIEIAKKIEEEAKYLKEYSEYAESYRTVITMMRSTPILRNYFNEICQNNRLIQYPGSVAAELYTIQSDLEHHVEIAKQKKIVAATTEQIELKKNLDADTLESLEKDLDRLEEAMSIQTKKLGDLNAELKEIEYLIQKHDRIVTLHGNILNSYHVQQEHLQGYVYSRYQEALWEIIMMLQTQLARKEDALAQLTNQQNIVAEIEYQLNEAIMNERVSKMAHMALSPTSGAIAEGLHRFVNVFTARMNRVINSIWSYPLHLQPFVMEDGQADLDYKFPFTTNNDSKPKKDVVEGSESMIDIFDFSFRFCALRQLGLGHLPLFLDEFESAFDDVHREKAVYFIKKMLDEQAFGQIFMISHYESNHGALTGLAQTCVLSKDNLLLSSDIVTNEHVSMS